MQAPGPTYRHAMGRPEGAFLDSFGRHSSAVGQSSTRQGNIELQSLEGRLT